MRNNILLFIAAIFISSCSDNIELKETDLIKYSWLIPFLNNSLGEFSEGTHNSDLGSMEFSFKVQEKVSGNVIYQIDSISKANNWKILDFTNSSISISKNISENLKDGGKINMDIELDTAMNQLLFKIE